MWCSFSTIDLSEDQITFICNKMTQLIQNMKGSSYYYYIVKHSLYKKKDFFYGCDRNFHLTVNTNVIKFSVVSPLTAKLFNLNFHPLEVVSR